MMNAAALPMIPCEAQESAEQIVEQHAAWLKREPGGMRATLWEADLRGADFRGAPLGRADLRDANLRRTDFWGADLQEAVLRGADLRKATLQVCNLREANLREANLRGADLGGADLREAVLRHADLRGANLWGADLRDADLRGADLRDADLRRVHLEGADLTGAKLSPYLIVPVEGSFLGWMPEGERVLKIEIPTDAARTNGIGSRICRTNRAVVRAVMDREGRPLPQAVVGQKSTGTLLQHPRIGDLKADSTQGIHFYMTFEEAAAPVPKVPDPGEDHL